MVTLEIVKPYLRILGSQDDATITLMMEAAIQKTTSRMRKPANYNDVGPVSKAFIMAVCIQTAFYYANRGDASVMDMDPPGYKSLIALEKPGASYV